MQGENQYQESIQRVQSAGHERLGLMTTWAYQDDPKRLAFTFARYKFVAKMLSGAGKVLEVGCGDGFISRVVRQEVGELKGVDFDPALIVDAEANRSEQWPIEFAWHDMLKGPVSGEFDAAYALDVLEHIPAEVEDRFIRHMIMPVKDQGVVIIGMPSLQSQSYASKQSKEGHVNCKDQRDLKKLMEKYFHNVFAFAMNDEVLHTGYHAMAHYVLVLCCSKKVP
jgi:2-polyprenyl-3-methyl-5-hydroxy-6-metoxy-1,4-benzoquinol methylase